VIYEWDREKARINLRSHRVAFEEAATVFLDPLAMTYADPDHSDDEDREITIGYSARQRLLFVCHCRRGDRQRLISAQRATRRERKQHEESSREEEA
jgi:uncharacterized DUF497 family protein